MGEGLLKVELHVGDYVTTVQNAEVLVKDTKGNIIYSITTDEHGVTEEVPLSAPDKNISMDPYSRELRFSVYDVEIPYINGYKKVIVHGVQIFDTVTSILPIQLHPLIQSNTPEENIDEIYIPLEHGIDMPKNPQGPPYYDNYSPDDNEPVKIMQSIMANEVKIPEYITVHLGSPNATAANVRVSFADYIKNVASSEIFPFWEESALYANIYAQISFALNRVYTVMR